MFGDYSSAPYRPARRASSVRMQQGRVWLDSDWNAQIELDAHRRELTTQDSIGCCGVPAAAPGFGITVAVAPGVGPDLLLSAGRAYAGGVLCELLDGDEVAGRTESGGLLLDRAVVDGRRLATGQWLTITAEDGTAQTARIGTVTALDDGGCRVTVAPAGGLVAGRAVRARRVASYLSQPDLPDAPPLVPGTTYVAYLDVSERHVTAIEDPSLREVALGGPDTTTRTVVVGQVRLHPWTGANPPTCLGLGTCWTPPQPGVPGRLAARATPDETAEGPCVVPAEAGYRRLENQSYVVVVRDGGATFVFSRDLGSITHAVASVAADGRVVLTQRPLDAYRTLRVGDWVEWVDDRATLTGQPGPLVQITAVDDGGTVVRTTPLLSAVGTDTASATHAYLRRWDGAPQPLTTGSWLPIEDGIEVRFEEGGTYRTGDVWVVPARTALDGPSGSEGGDVLWPRDGDEPRFEVAHQPPHRFLPLAVLQATGGTWTVEDCRPIFVPAAQEITFELVGGDGQQASPGSELPAPIEVRVTRGGRPLVGAPVRFEVRDGGGALLDAQPERTTGADGVAAARWRLGSGGTQRVEARLLDGVAAPVPGAVARFGATVATPAQGGGCSHTVGRGGEFGSVGEALKALATRGEEEICLCLVAGIQDLGLDELDGTAVDGVRSVTIGGCGPQSILVLRGTVRVHGLRRFHLHDLAVVSDHIVEGGAALVTADGCGEVLVERCWLAATTEPPVPRQRPAGAALQLVDVGRARVRDCVLEASFPVIVSDRPGPMRITDGTFLQELFLAQEQSPVRFAGPLFAELAERAARQLAEDEGQRNETAKRVGTMAREFFEQLSTGERTAYGRFAATAPQTKDPSAIAALLEAIRRAWLRSEAGLALVLGADRRPIEDPFKLLADTEVGDTVQIEGCEVLGSISVAGAATLDELDQDTLKRLDARATDNLVDAQGPNVRLAGNQVGRLLVGLAVLQLLTPQAQRRVTNVPARLTLEGNTVTGAGHLVAAGRLAVTATMFSWSSAFRLGAAAGPRLLGAGLADTATYTANQCDLASLWISAARADANAANVQLQV